MGEWIPTDSSGSLVLTEDNTFTIEGLTIDPINRTKPVGDFSGEGSWTIEATGTGSESVVLKFAYWRDSGRIEEPAGAGVLYNMGSSRAGGKPQLYLEDASLETRVFLVSKTG